MEPRLNQVFTDITSGEKKIIDLLAEISFSNKRKGVFIIHIEHQSSTETDFNRRMFQYFARLHEKYGCAIYPIVIYSHDTPLLQQTDNYRVDFPDGFNVLDFHYRVIQLNQLDWTEYIQKANPVASALVPKMRMNKKERPIVKLRSLQLLASLELNPAKTELVSAFIDTYLNLNAKETAVFNQQLATIEPKQEEAVMQIVTSWMQQGIEQGIDQGRLKEAESLVMRLLSRRFGELSPQLQEKIKSLNIPQLENLGEALLDFTSIADLEAYLTPQSDR